MFNKRSTKNSKCPLGVLGIGHVNALLANELNASAILDVSKQAYDNLWTYYADSMEWAWESAENQLDRINNLAIANLDAKTRAEVSREQSSSTAGSALGGMVGSLGSALIKGYFKVQ